MQNVLLYGSRSTNHGGHKQEKSYFAILTPSSGNLLSRGPSLGVIYVCRKINLVELLLDGDVLDKGVSLATAGPCAGPVQPVRGGGGAAGARAAPRVRAHQGRAHPRAVPAAPGGRRARRVGRARRRARAPAGAALRAGRARGAVAGAGRRRVRQQLAGAPAPHQAPAPPPRGRARGAGAARAQALRAARRRRAQGRHGRLQRLHLDT